MSEGNLMPGATPEIAHLILELEGQIASMTGALEELRATATRLSAAASPDLSFVPPHAGFGALAEADEPEVESSLAHESISALAEAAFSSDEEAPPPAEEPVEIHRFEEAPVFRMTTTPPPPIEAPTPAPEVFGGANFYGDDKEAGFWDSVAEGASWPTPKAKPPAETTLDHVPEPEEAEGATEEPPALLADESLTPEASEPAADVGTAEVPSWQVDAPVTYETAMADGAPVPELETPVNVAETVEPDAATQRGSTEWEIPSTAEAYVDEWQMPAVAATTTTPEPEAAEATEAPEGPAEAQAPSAESDETARSLSSGWPDESAWSQSFEWPALKRGLGEVTSDAEPAPQDDGDDDVSAIVAQIRAELEEANRYGSDVSHLDFKQDHNGQSPAEAESDDTRDDVSRTVAQIRAELEAARTLTGAVQDEEDAPYAADQGQVHFAPGAPADEPEGDSDVREEVRRAVEAARAELAGESEIRPAFPLAAPKSPLADWSTTSVDVSGPPVIVIKDSEGRVELASVFEMLNAMDCGDSAALLNYTPHSVTVGLPARVKVPSSDRIVEVVEQVFTRDCRVESDGVRITVIVGADTKSIGKEGAA